MSKLDEIFQDRIVIGSDVSFDKISIITPSSRGVILFTDQNDTSVQLLAAADIRRTVRAKLFSQDDLENKSKRADLSEIVKYIYILKCSCEFETGWRHFLIAKQIYPKEFKEYINTYKASWLTIDLDKKWPNFSISDNPFDKQNAFGPFASQSDCSFLIETITHAYSLCRNQTCLSDPEKAQSCPYLQMGICDGVCVDKISRDEYLNRIHSAVKVITDQDKILTKLNEKMIQHSKDMRFEQAAKFKTLIEKLNKKQDIFKWISKIEDLAIIHVDKSEKVKVADQKKKVQSYAGFLVRSGHIYKMQDFTLDNIDTFANTISSVKPLDTKAVNTDILRYQLNISAYYLYRSNRKGLWLDNGKLNSQELKEKVFKFVNEDLT